MCFEKTIERNLRDKVKARGGLALKFVSPGMAGMPDRLLLLPGGRVYFVEVKAPGELMRPLQIKRKTLLEKLGFCVYCLDTKEAVGRFLDEVCTL